MPSIRHAAPSAALVLLCLTIGVARASTPCDPAAHGVVPGPVDSNSFQALLQACAGRTITFASGTYSFMPSPANPTGFFIWGGSAQTPTVLQGSGDAVSQNDATVFKVEPGGTYPFQSLLFILNNAAVSNGPAQVVNASNVTIENIVFQGSTTPAGCPAWDYGNAIWIQSNAIPAAASIENISLIRNVFVNFNGMHWVAAVAGDGSPGIGQQSEIAIVGNTFDASSANSGSCVNNSANTTPVYQILLSGSSYLPTGRVSNVSIASNNFQSQFVKGAVMVTSDSNRISIYDNLIEGAGTGVLPASGWSTEQGRYAISLYHTAGDVGGQGLTPDTIWIEANRIHRPISAGIYAALATNLLIQQNAIDGQIDSFDGTEPKAAIALNHSSTMPLFPIVANDMQANRVGIGVANGNVTIGQNFIGVPVNGYGMKINAGKSSSLDVEHLTISTSSTNAVSVSGAGDPDTASSLSITQEGWLPCGGKNRALSWYRDYVGGTPISAYADVPTFNFIGVTAGRKPQTAFWQPTCD